MHFKCAPETGSICVGKHRGVSVRAAQAYGRISAGIRRRMSAVELSVADVVGELVAVDDDHKAQGPFAVHNGIRQLTNKHIVSRVP